MAAKGSCVEIEVAERSTAPRKRTAWRNLSLSALFLALWWFDLQLSATGCEMDHLFRLSSRCWHASRFCSRVFCL